MKMKKHAPVGEAQMYPDFKGLVGAVINTNALQLNNELLSQY